MLIRSTMAATTASRTRTRGTLLAIRKVLSSTAALSTECPSANARSRDNRTSCLNSDSSLASAEAAIPLGVLSGSELVEEDAPMPKFNPEVSFSSSELSLSSSEEVIEPGSERSRSDALSPVQMFHAQAKPRRERTLKSQTYAH